MNWICRRLETNRVLPSQVSQACGTSYHPVSPTQAEVVFEVSRPEGATR